MKFGTVASIVGMIVALIGLFMMIPALYALFIGEPEASAIVVSSVITLVAGLSIRFACRPEPLGIKDSFGIVTFGWVFASIFGALPFFLARPETGVVNCFFESISGFTTTGATIYTGEPGFFELPRSILLWRCLMQWIGGMGVIMMVIVLLPFMESSGLSVLRAEVTVISEKIRPKIRDTGLVLAGIYVALTVIQSILLCTAGMPAYDSVCHSLTTLSTGGFSPHTQSIAGYDSVWIEIIIMVFMAAGGMSFLAHFRLLRGDLFAHKRSSEIRLFLSIILIFAAASTVNRMTAPDTVSLAQAAREGIFTGVSFVTTTGFTNCDYTAWPGFSVILIVILMFAGGCVGSTGGSIKMRRILVVAKLVFREIWMVRYPNRVLKIRMDNEVMDEQAVRKIFAFVVLWMILFLLIALILASFGWDIATSVSASASCLGNVGPALGTVASDYAALGTAEKLVLGLGMLIGRLELFTVLVLFSPALWRRPVRNRL